MLGTQLEYGRAGLLVMVFGFRGEVVQLILVSKVRRMTISWR
jgi:hypothetical protein